MARVIPTGILVVVLLFTVGRAQQSTQPAAATIAGPHTVEVDVACGRCTVSWNEVAGAAGYQILRGLKPDAEDAKVIGEVKKATLEFKDTTAPSGQVYYFVRVYGESGSVAAQPRNVPAASPANLAVDVDWANQTATVTWARVPDAIGYTVYYQKCNLKWDVAIGKQTIENTIQLTNISPQRWRFWVAANNDCGEGPSSEPISSEPENNRVPCRQAD